MQNLENMCSFLGEDYDDALMEFHTTPVAQRRGKKVADILPKREDNVESSAQVAEEA